jgi:hypothetical protein
MTLSGKRIAASYLYSTGRQQLWKALSAYHIVVERRVVTDGATL